MERIRENSYAVKFSRFAGLQKSIPVYRLKGTLNGAKENRRAAGGCICITATGSVFFRKTENRIMQGSLSFEG